MNCNSQSISIPSLFSRFTNSLLRSEAALSALIIRVLPHWNELVLATMLIGSVYVRLLPPVPVICSLIPSTSITRTIFVVSRVTNCRISDVSSVSFCVACTPTIQVPCFVRKSSVVNSTVVLCSPITFSCPYALKRTRCMKYTVCKPFMNPCPLS